MTRYYGVRRAKQSSGWVASARVDGVAVHLGTFKSAKEAALAYDDAVRSSAMIHGHNRLNFAGPQDLPFVGETVLPSSFWSKVMPEPTTGCWLWTASATKAGYGACTTPVSRLAHRASWIDRRGRIPAGLVIDHKCHTRRCVNPDHLRLATRGQNNTYAAKSWGSSRFRGVRRSANGVGWVATITTRGRALRLGTFSSEKDAALAYDSAALLIHGEFAMTNKKMGLL